MKKKIEITKDIEPIKKEQKFQECWPIYKSGDHITTRWMAKVDLFYLNGKTNFIKMEMPVMIGGNTEEAYQYLKSYACELITLFLPVSHYQISTGSIDKDGAERWYIKYKPEEVPLGKVWVKNWPLGMWMEPQKIKDGRWIIDGLPENKNKGRGPYPFPYNEPHEIVEPKIY